MYVQNFPKEAPSHGEGYMETVLKNMRHWYLAKGQNYIISTRSWTLISQSHLGAQATFWRLDLLDFPAGGAVSSAGALVCWVFLRRGTFPFFERGTLILPIAPLALWAGRDKRLSSFPIPWADGPAYNDIMMSKPSNGWCTTPMDKYIIKLFQTRFDLPIAGL